MKSVRVVGIDEWLQTTKIHPNQKYRRDTVNLSSVLIVFLQGLPNGTFAQQELWLACCEAHDYTYWKGGTYQDSLNADNELELCVAATGEPHIALFMLAGVRGDGTPYLPTKFRWGYGWPYLRGYKELTHEENEHVNKPGQ